MPVSMIADDGLAGAASGVPAFRGVDVGVHPAAGLAGVVQAPQRAERRVVRDDAGPDGVVRLGEPHARHRCEYADRGADRNAAGQVHQVTAEPERDRADGQRRGGHRCQRRTAGRVGERDHHPAGFKRGGRGTPVFELFDPQAACRTRAQTLRHRGYSTEGDVTSILEWTVRPSASQADAGLAARTYHLPRGDATSSSPIMADRTAGDSSSAFAGVVRPPRTRGAGRG